MLSKGNVEEATISKEELKTMLDIASTEGTFQKERSSNEREGEVECILQSKN